MLTKDLLKYKKQKNKIIPIFIDPQNSTLLELAEILCHVSMSSRGEPTGDAAGSTHIQIINQIFKLIKNKNVQNIDPGIVLLDTLPSS